MALGAKKPPVDLAIIMGGPPKKKPAMGGDDDDEDDAPESRPMGEHKQHDEGEGEDLPAGFEEAFSEAFPDASGDMERMQAVKRLIHICAGSY